MYYQDSILQDKFKACSAVEIRQLERSCNIKHYTTYNLYYNCVFAQLPT